MRNSRLKDILGIDSGRWSDWRWQMAQRPICSDPAQLVDIGILDSDFPPLRRISLTPYLVRFLLNLKKVDRQGYQAEILQSFLPVADASEQHQWVWARRHDLALGRIFAKLPLPALLKTLFYGRGTETSTQGLENIYPLTDVVIATSLCARNCSFCFREVGDAQGEAAQQSGNMGVVMEAIRQVIARRTPHVLVTGGDPLTRNTAQLRELLTPLVNSDTVQVLRLATRLVVDLPMRFFDEELLGMLRIFSDQMKRRRASLRIVTQVNHPCELTPEALQALANIQACGIEVLNQTVVLRGVNDDVATLRRLFLQLDRLGVRSHKLFHPMPVPSTEHLRIPLRKFRKLLAGLHQWLPGTAVPQANAATLVGKMPVGPSGRWIVPVPFTNRLLCRSFRGEWYLFRDAWDYGRNLLEGCAAALLIVLFLIATRSVKQSGAPMATVHVTDIQPIVRVVTLAGELGYPDAWARQYFVPFVQDGTLFLPIQGLTSRTGD